MKTLALTSPLMRVPAVKTAQGKLIRGGWLRAGTNDGVYGPETARAAARAHWELGFPDKLAHAGTYGDTLDQVVAAFLKEGVQGLAADYARSRAIRLRAQTIGDKALAYLKQHVGETEKPPGSNVVPWASTWYGVTGPWCAMAVTRAYVEAGSKGFVRGVRWAYVPYIVADAAAAANGLTRTFTPRPGDLVCFNWDGGVFDHVGLVDRPPASIATGQPFTTVEGNTSFDDAGDQSNGGACAAKDRSILGAGRTVFVRVTK